MSGLLSQGGECSAGANPLARYTKHLGADRSLQQDRFVGNEAAQRPSTGFRHAQLHAQADFEDFAKARSGPSPGAPIQACPAQTCPADACGTPEHWAAEFAPRHEVPVAQFQQMNMGPATRGSSSPWLAEFGAHPATPPPQQQQQQQQQYRQPQMYRPFMGGGMYGMHMHPRPLMDSSSSSKGKQRMVELSDEGWEEQFRKLEIDGIAGAAEGAQDSAKVHALADDEMVRVVDADGEQNLGDFESIWRGIQEEALANGHDKSRLDHMAEEWRREFAGPDEPHLDAQGKPNLGEYKFEPENPFISHVDPFSEGMRILDQGGSLSRAALAFEAAVQQTDGTRQDAWTQLGMVQASNEKEEPAIRALERAVTLGENDLQAMMALAVSYTNEGYDAAAYITLQRWIESKYPGLMPATSDTANSSPRQIRESVTESFLAAARRSPSGTAMDADVQVGLGVLFYSNEDFDKAIDCFTAALRVRPDDHLLWNRLGATLANSGKSEEAINAYNEALAIKPTFVRARYNLGVSCINIGCYEQAAQHLLGALSMHQLDVDAPSSVNISSNLWSTLRRVFLVGMNRPDLADQAITGTDVSVFRQHIDF